MPIYIKDVKNPKIGNEKTILELDQNGVCVNHTHISNTGYVRSLCQCGEMLHDQGNRAICMDNFCPGKLLDYKAKGYKLYNPDEDEPSLIWEDVR
jgi:hypothetical protein